jgi:hypothetical protein
MCYNSDIWCRSQFIHLLYYSYCALPKTNVGKYTDPECGLALIFVYVVDVKSHDLLHLNFLYRIYHAKLTGCSFHVIACLRWNYVVILLPLFSFLSYIFRKHLLRYRLINPTQEITQIQALVSSDAGFLFSLLLLIHFIRYFNHCSSQRLMVDIYLTS